MLSIKLYSQKSEVQILCYSQNIIIILQFIIILFLN